MKRYLPLFFLAAASLAGDFLCRSLASGGNQDRLLETAGKAIDRFPETIGTWRSAPGESLSDDVLRILDCRHYTSRIYVDDETGDRVGLLLLAGPAGPMVAHTPEICYESSSFEMSEGTTTETIRGTGDRADIFDRVSFRSRSVAGQNQRVYYAWRKFDGYWQAPKNPRLTIGGQPMLYKLQLAADSGGPGAKPTDLDPARRFLNDLLPVLDNILKTN